MCLCSVHRASQPDANDFQQVNKFCWEIFQLNCNDVQCVGQRPAASSGQLLGTHAAALIDLLFIC